MTSLRRSYLIGFFVVLSGLATYCKTVQTWTAQEYWGAIGVASAITIGVLQKSPRDAAMSDSANAPIVGMAPRIVPGYASSTVTSKVPDSVTLTTGAQPTDGNAP